MQNPAIAWPAYIAGIRRGTRSIGRFIVKGAQQWHWHMTVRSNV